MRETPWTLTLRRKPRSAEHTAARATVSQTWPGRGRRMRLFQSLSNKSCQQPKSSVRSQDRGSCPYFRGLSVRSRQTPISSQHLTEVIYIAPSRAPTRLHPTLPCLRAVRRYCKSSVALTHLHLVSKIDSTTCSVGGSSQTALWSLQKRHAATFSYPSSAQVDTRFSTVSTLPVPHGRSVCTNLGAYAVLG